MYVPHPERWWIAAREDLAWLTDPDVDDGRVRWPDRDQRQWTAVAGVVDAVGRAIAYGGHDVDEEDPTVALVPVDMARLAPADRNIVRSWFRAGAEAPSGDPWDDSLTNGRHRLWNAWRAAPDALLPVYSDTLAGIDDAALMGEQFAAVVAQSAVDGLRELPTGPANRSPRFVDELRRVARDGGHDVDGLPAMVADSGRGSWWSRLTGR